MNDINYEVPVPYSVISTIKVALRSEIARFVEVKDPEWVNMCREALAAVEAADSAALIDWVGKLVEEKTTHAEL